MKLARLNFPDVHYVAANMRDWDRREIFATRWVDDPSDFAKEVLSYGEFGWVAGGDSPIACFGARALWPGVWIAWMFATDDLPKIGLSLSRFVRNNIIPTLRQVGAHRIHAYSMAGHDDAHRWLRFLGAEIEAEHRAFGRNGEDFLVFAMR